MGFEYVVLEYFVEIGFQVIQIMGFEQFECFGIDFEDFDLV